MAGLRLRRKRGKLLGGAPPRRGRRWARAPQKSEGTRSTELLLVLTGSLFALGVAIGFAWQLDRQLRGGVIRQATEGERRPDWVSLRELPRHVPEAFLAVVEPGRLQRGSLRTARDRRSTSLSRELVRQVHLLEPTISGEGRAMAMSPLLNRRLGTRNLLEIFLNRVELGRVQGYPVFGVHHAAREYFQKTPRELTLAEAAMLAGLLLPPRIEDPEERVGAVAARRREVLRVLLEGELISPAEYQRALQEPLGLRPGLDQIPFSRPADWASGGEPIRIPPELRPSPPQAQEPQQGS